MNKTSQRKYSHTKSPETLVTLRFSASYLQKDYIVPDAMCRQELELLRLSYVSKSQKFASLKSLACNWYLCPRAHRLGLHKAKEYLLELLAPDTNLVCYLRRYNPHIIGYGWSKIGTESVNTRLRKHFICAILEGKTEITLFIPDKLMQQEYNHGRN